MQQHQLGHDSESSNEDSAADQEESGEEEEAAQEAIRRQRSSRAPGRKSLLSRIPANPPSNPSRGGPEPSTDPSGDMLQSWGGSRAPRRVQDPQEDLGPAAAAEALGLGLGLSPLGQNAFAPGALPAVSEGLVFGQMGNLDPQGLVCSPFQSSQINRVRANQGGPAAAVACLDLPFNLPFSSNRVSSSLAGPR